MPSCYIKCKYKIVNIFLLKTSARLKLTQFKIIYPVDSILKSLNRNFFFYNHKFRSLLFNNSTKNNVTKENAIVVTNIPM